MSDEPQLLGLVPPLENFLGFPLSQTQWVLSFAAAVSQVFHQVFHRADMT